MPAIHELVERMRNDPKGIRFVHLCRVCDSYFGKPRQSGTSHRVYKIPWPGEGVSGEAGAESHREIGG